MRIELKRISASSFSRSIARRTLAIRASYSPRVIVSVSVGATIAGAVVIVIACSLHSRVAMVSGYVNREGVKGRRKVHTFLSSFFASFAPSRFNGSIRTDGDADAIHQVPHAAAGEFGGARRFRDIGCRAGDVEGDGDRLAPRRIRETVPLLRQILRHWVADLHQFIAHR